MDGGVSVRGDPGGPPAPSVTRSSGARQGPTSRTAPGPELSPCCCDVGTDTLASVPRVRFGVEPRDACFLLTDQLELGLAFAARLPACLFLRPLKPRLLPLRHDDFELLDDGRQGLLQLLAIAVRPAPACSSLHKRPNLETQAPGRKEAIGRTSVHPRYCSFSHVLRGQ